MQALNSNQSRFSKYISYEKGDGTQCTQNFSKFCQNCKLTKDDLQVQIFSLKDKAHQSFMQVIQVQQLHEQEIQLMKQQHQDQITALREQISKLESHVNKTKEDLISMQKNSKHHICQVQSPSFFIDSIDIINCQDEDGRQNNLDQSSYVQFNEFISFKNISKEQQFLKNQTETLKQVVKTKQYEQKITKLNIRILQLESQVQSLWQTNQQLKKQAIRHQGNSKIMKNNYDSLYKESKFMSDHIRQLSNDKFKLQRRIKQLQKEIKQFKILPNLTILKKSMTFEQQANNSKIKMTGSGIFRSQESDNVRNSLQSSKDSKDSGQNKTVMLKSLDFQDLIKVKSSTNIMAKSDVFSRNQQIKVQDQVRKSMPNYKKISHVPSFKKMNSANRSPVIQKDFLIVKPQYEQKQSSNFIQDIYKQLQHEANVANLKRSYGPMSQQTLKKQMFKDNSKKANWYQKTC